MENNKNKLILTSNLAKTADNNYFVNYNSLLNGNNEVKDNAALMLLKLLIKCQIKHVSIAGFDGFSHEQKNNYANEDLVLSTNDKVIDIINENISFVINSLKEDMEINFITPTKYNINC